MVQDASADLDLEIPEILPVIPVQSMTVFPFVITPLSISRKRGLQAVEASLASHRLVVLVGQKPQSQEDPSDQELYEIGTVAMIMRILKLPDGQMRILVQGIRRGKLEYFTIDKPYREAKLVLLSDHQQEDPDLEEEALLRNVKALLERSASLGKPVSSEVLVIANGLESPGRLADLVASNTELKMTEAQAVLEELDVHKRLMLVNEFLSKETTLLEMQQQINSQARGEMDRTQRDFYLRQQLKVIQTELGEGNELQEEIAAYRARIEKLKMPEEASEEVEKQLRRLEHMHPDTAETGLIRSYLDWMTELPWGKCSEDCLDLKRARIVLEEDHFGLDKVKERILEFLAVRRLNPDMKNPILCFVGPPGVGKTSLGRSIARALNRKVVNLSLGGLRDEAEIRGHRKTYVGALPGRIIQGISQAGTMNPVFIMDEVDKIGQDYRGDPSAALLEVLDPEQNHRFRDHFLGVCFDLSRTMFILTANTTDTIHPAFRDRLEIIELGSYTLAEKTQIAMRYLLPRQIAEHGLDRKKLRLSKAVITVMIEQYTREAGLRNLDRWIATICRKVARKVAEGEYEACQVTKATLSDYLGAPKLFPDARLTRNQVGVAAGLAWTPSGGEIMFVESSTMKGNGNLLLTGQLGDVMKESAQLALTWIRSKSDVFRIPDEMFSKRDIHIHFPEGAIPKDGPSAGITVATALLSCLTQRKVRCDVAMTGELTLRGDVLPVGGLKEKILAAVRAGISHLIFPRLNQNDLKDFEGELPASLTLKPVKNISEVFSAALEDPHNISH